MCSNGCLYQKEVIEIIKQVLLYERVQGEYDLMIASLATLSDEAIAESIHEVMVKTLILGLVVDECYTQEELDFLLGQDKPLELMHDVFMKLSAKIPL